MMLTPPKKAVLDTGPLFTLLTLRYSQERPDLRESLRYKHGLPQYLPDPTSEREFFDYLWNIPALLTSAHVIGELRSRHKIAKNLSADFWRCAMGFFEEKKLDERSIPVRALHQDGLFQKIACELGPTDAGLLLLARQESCELLTDDEQMFQWQPADGNPAIRLIQYSFKP